MVTLRLGNHFAFMPCLGFSLNALIALLVSVVRRDLGSNREHNIATSLLLLPVEVSSIPPIDPSRLSSPPLLSLST